MNGDPSVPAQNCVFCGATTPATTKEHCPPRSLFVHRHWPEGFEFPSCLACNQGSGNHDAIVALLGRSDPWNQARNADRRYVGLLKNVNQQFPRMLRRMLDLSPIESRRAARRLKMRPGPGQTYRDLGIVRITPEMDAAVRTLAGKLVKATYFKETGRIFPTEGGILLHWFTNATRLEHGSIPALDLCDFSAGIPRIARNGKDLSDQFDYRVSFTEGARMGVLRAVFGKAFGLVAIFALDRERLIAMGGNARMASGRVATPFQLLQQ